MVARICQGCGTPLVRRVNERDGQWAIRKFCSAHCWDMHRPIRNRSRGAGRQVANRRISGEPCEVCGMPYGGRGGPQRHHIDGDTWNNARSNIAFLCPKHHQEAHKRRDGRGPGGGPRPRVAALMHDRTLVKARRAWFMKQAGMTPNDISKATGWRPHSIRLWFRKYRNELAA